MPRIKSPPSYRFHKARNCAVVTIDGRNHYLGPFGSPQSHDQYARLIAERKAGPGSTLHPTVRANGDVPKSLVVKELLAAYWRHAKIYYRTPDGQASSELSSIRQALRFIRRLYDDSSATEYGPLALKATRQAMIDAGWSRTNINRAIDRVRRVFRWAVENEQLPPANYQALKAVPGLRRGRSGARESDPVKPVPLDHVEATLPFLSPALAAAVQVQLLTGCRPGEILAMRPCDLDTAGKVWIYRPAAHKNAWRGHERQIYVGPKAQAILLPFLTLTTTAYIFSPRASRESEVTDPHRSPACRLGFASLANSTRDNRLSRLNLAAGARKIPAERGGKHLRGICTAGILQVVVEHCRGVGRLLFRFAGRALLSKRGFGGRHLCRGRLGDGAGSLFRFHVKPSRSHHFLRIAWMA